MRVVIKRENERVLPHFLIGSRLMARVVFTIQRSCASFRRAFTLLSEWSTSREHTLVHTAYRVNQSV